MPRWDVVVRRFGMALLPGEQDSSRDGGQLEAEDGSVFFVNPWGKHL